MFYNIKSKYILKLLFSYLQEKIKLKLCKYSKSLKNKLDIDLLNYRRFSGRYIIYEQVKGKQKVKEFNTFTNELLFECEYLNGKREGMGKEYYYDEKIFLEFQAIFEGEYLNGKRNGKGKEYYLFYNEKENVIFEGEYLNGKRNGKGKEYYDNGDLKFEGEYLNGVQIHGIRHDPSSENNTYEYTGNGFIKDYNQYGSLIFEGEYLNGLKNGKGKEYYNSGQLKFEGEYLNGLRNGKGKEYDINTGELIFEGEYLNDLRNGKGKEYDEFGELIFEGEYLNGKMWKGKNDSKNYKISLKNGKGFMKILKEEDGEIKTVFEAEYLNGELNGKVKDFIGKTYNESFQIYFAFEGECKNNQKEGKGKEYIVDNQLVFEGEYLYNQKLRGKSYIDNKLEFEGEYLCDKKWDGKGYDENGNIIYELKKGTGKVKEYNNKFQCLEFSGEYLNGFRNGKGKEHYNFEKLKFEGEYLNGLRNGKGKEYYNTGKLEYEGEYLNGLRNGKGKEYDINRGNLTFEGEYFEGKKWNGYEKEYYIDGGDFTQHLSYEGHVINGKRGPNLLDKNSNS